MKNNLVKDKSFKFSIRIINLYKFLTKEKKEFVLSKQILKSGTSIGANIEESIGAQSKNEFVSKISTALKESRETDYWLRLLVETDYITKEEAYSIIQDNNDILNLLYKIRKTACSSMSQ